MRDYYIDGLQRPLKLRISKKSIFVNILIILLFTIISFGNTIQALGIEKQQKPTRTIVFSTVFPEFFEGFEEMKLIYAEAFRRLGYNFNLVSQPAERALIEADSGNVDGEAARISYLNDNNDYPNLVRVAEWLMIIKDAAYATDNTIQVNGWQSLNGKNYVVGALKGLKSVEKWAPRYIKKENIIYFTDIQQGLDMLLAGRIELCIIGTLIENTHLMKQPKYKDIKRVGIVEEKYIHAFMHKKHKDLAYELAATLKAMKKEGAFKRLLEQAQKEWGDKRR